MSDRTEDVPYSTDVDDTAIIATARRRHGAAGALIAAGMLGIDKVLRDQPREEPPIVIAADSDPIDVDADGIRVRVADDTEVVAPPQERSAPLMTTPRKPSRSRRWR